MFLLYKKIEKLYIILIIKCLSVICIMKIWTNIKRFAVIGGASALGTMSALATPILENDALTGLDTYGTNIGDFLGNLTPGLAKFLFTMAIIVAVIGVIVGAVAIAKRFMGSYKR